ncbi:helix-turn-helix domain-containing protein [Rhizobium sp. RCC_161_2]|uniref:helix-turn-helix domain-containing protein n=1 Tax=Rhizobium sp. RCC_161_2 TaxID=3239219 RepID=UPI0035265CA5
MIEEAKARRKRFEIAGRLAKMRKSALLPAPKPAAEAFVTKKLPLWEQINLNFDAHVVAYRVSMSISSFSLSGSARPASEWGGKVRRSIDSIVLEVLANYPGVSIANVQSSRRTRKVVKPRQEAMFEVFIQRPDLSLPMIGRWFRKDHTTIIHAVRKIEAMRGAA